jgi:hypothetical protein
MKTLNCDVCGVEIVQPIMNRNYFHVAHRDLCEKCHDALEAHIKPVVRTKQPFTYEWYNDLVQSSIEEAMKNKGFEEGKISKR